MNKSKFIMIHNSENHVLHAACENTMFLYYMFLMYTEVPTTALKPANEWTSGGFWVQAKRGGKDESDW